MVVNRSMCLFAPCCIISIPKKSIYFPVTFKNGSSCNIIKPWNRNSGYFFSFGLEQFFGSKDTDTWTYNVFILLLFICTILVSRNLNHGPNFYCSRMFKCRLKNEHFCKELSAEIVGSDTLSCITELPRLGFSSKCRHFFGWRMGMLLLMEIKLISSVEPEALLRQAPTNGPLSHCQGSPSWVGTCWPPVRQQNTSKVFEI